MTVDEAAFAGGLAHYESNNWYGYNSANEKSTGIVGWWLLTPAYTKTDGVRGHAIYPANSSGLISTGGVDSKFAVRPVISLKSSVVYKSGDGTAENPYEILTN